MKGLTRIGLVAAMGMAASGCFGFEIEGREGSGWSGGSAYPDAPPRGSVGFTGDLDVRGGQLAGALGPIDGFSAEAYEQRGFHEEGWSEVTLHAGTGYWVMTALSVEGGLEHPSLAPGARLEFPRDAQPGLSVSVLGCSGPAREVFDYDEDAQRVQIEVQSGASPGERVLLFRAVFDNAGTSQVVEGSFSYTMPETRPETWGPTGGSLDIGQGMLRGSMGPIRDFDALPYRYEGTNFGGSTNVTLHAGTGYWVMTGLTIDGGLGHPDLTPGASLSFRDAERPWESGALFVSVIGCSGPSEGSFEFDDHASQVDVRIREGVTPAQRHMDFTLQFTTGQTVDGSFAYTAPAAR
jgi:hypothetical protein